MKTNITYVVKHYGSTWEVTRKWFVADPNTWIDLPVNFLPAYIFSCGQICVLEETLVGKIITLEVESFDKIDNLPSLLFMPAQ